ncbi:MAG TPA: hypothetical protein VEC57_17990 [Candidatus Limnocylindrales bacterium]|nr:hypothetical protein [Candidatus Limnocylindrales bacterium]
MARVAAARPGGTNGVRGMRDRLLAIAGCCAIVAGCGTLEARMYDLQQLAPDALVGPGAPQGLQLAPLVSNQRNVFTRSYHIGETYTSRAGEAMISVKNYTVMERIGRATALADFEQTCGRSLLGRRGVSCRRIPLAAVRGTAGAVFSVVGAVRTADGDYFAVAMPAEPGTEVYLLVDRRGALRKGAYVVWRRSKVAGLNAGGVTLDEVVPDSLLFEEDKPLFRFETVERFVASGPGYLNFDVVYSGFRSGSRTDNYVLTYREYGRDATDRASFTQQLPFSIANRDIDIMGLRVHVEDVTPDSITFQVLQDAQSTAR